jgi:mRNA interferase MazF
MTAYKRGDIVLVNFLFSDESGPKHRPVVVISSPIYHRSRQEIVVASVTSNIDRMLFGDCLLAGWKEAGLLFPSLVTGIIRPIKSEMIHRRLGSIPPREMISIDLNLHEILDLKIRRNNN